MNRLQIEQDYWNDNALDDDVDIKYISDAPTDLCLKDILPLKGKVLDLGCGVGRLTPSGQYGVDISRNMIDIAKKRRSDCYFTYITDYALPFDEKTFNVVFSYLVIQHLKPEAVRAYISESCRVLKNGGTFKIQFIEGTEREPFSNHYSKAEIRDWFLSSGFKDVIFKQSVAYSGWTIAKGVK